MLGIRPYKPVDAQEILSWCQDETAFYQWTAGILGDYPLSREAFRFVETLMPFTAFDERGIVGFFTLRNPGGSVEELRFGFVILNPDLRGKGFGKAMLRLGIRFAFEIYGARQVSLGVFENNLPAYYCYKAAGFSDVTPDTPETYWVMGEEWKCRELELKARLCEKA